MQQILWRFMGQTPTTRDDKPLAARDPQVFELQEPKKEETPLMLMKVPLDLQRAPWKNADFETPIYPVGSMGLVYIDLHE